MSNSVRPHRRYPTRLLCPQDSPGKNTGVGCHFLLQCMKVKVKLKSLNGVRPSATPWTAAYQAPQSMGFSRQQYWSGWPLPSPLYSFSSVRSVAHSCPTLCDPLGQDKSLCFSFIFQYMRMRIEPMLKDYCKDKANHTQGKHPNFFCCDYY